MKKDLLFANYGNSILGIPNSILKHYGAKNLHDTLPLLDDCLKKNYKNVVLMIFDGMGSDMLSKNSAAGSLFNSYKIADISSVFPCTTVAAITTFQSGLSPIEHGWLGWSCYFSEAQNCVDLFSNNISGIAAGKPASDIHLAENLMKYESIFDKIRKATNGSVETSVVSPFSEYYADTCETVCTHIRDLCAKEGSRFIYAYHFQPDYEMHHVGCCNDKIKLMLEDFDGRLEKLCNDLEDTLIIVTADHGLRDVKMLCIDDYPQLYECLKIPPSIEPRCISFFVKEEFKKVFAERFINEFGNKFLLLTKMEALKKNLFGKGVPQKKALDFIGDYIAVATDDIALWYKDTSGEYKDFKAAHAGINKKEMLVPLIVIET